MFDAIDSDDSQDYKGRFGISRYDSVFADMGVRIVVCDLWEIAC